MTTDTSEVFDSQPSVIPDYGVVLLDMQGQPLRTVRLSAAGIAIGRLPSSDLVLDAPTVSRSHVRIEWDGHAVLVTDLGTRSGTQLGNRRLLPQQAQPWYPDDVLQIGPHALRLQPGIVPQRPTVRTPIAPVAAPAVERLTLAFAPGQAVFNLLLGQPANANLVVANNSAEPINALITLEGLPANTLVTPEQPQVIAPHSSAFVPLTVTVPETAESVAGVYAITVRARALEDATISSAVYGRWDVLPFAAGEIDLLPRRVEGSTEGVYTVRVTNRGNAAALYTLSALDEDDTLVGSFPQPEVEVEPGQSLDTPLTIRAERRWIGQAQRHNFHVRAESTNETLNTSGAFVHAPLLPLWAVAGIATMLLLFLAVGFQLINQPPDNNTPRSNTTLAGGTTPAPGAGADQTTTAVGTSGPVTSATGTAGTSAATQFPTVPNGTPPIFLTDTTTATATRTTQTTAATGTAVGTGTPIRTLTPRPTILDATTSATDEPSDDQATQTAEAGGLPKLSIQDDSFPEGDGRATRRFFVTLSSPTAGVSVKYNVTNGTAELGTNYTVVTNTLTFGPDETLKWFDVEVIGDKDVNVDRTFTVTLDSSSSNAQIDPARKKATVTIVNDESEIAFKPLGGIVFPINQEFEKFPTDISVQLSWNVDTVAELSSDDNQCEVPEQATVRNATMQIRIKGAGVCTITAQIRESSQFKASKTTLEITARSPVIPAPTVIPTNTPEPPTNTATATNTPEPPNTATATNTLEPTATKAPTTTVLPIDGAVDTYVEVPSASSPRNGWPKISTRMSGNEGGGRTPEYIAYIRFPNINVPNLEGTSITATLTLYSYPDGGTGGGTGPELYILENVIWLADIKAKLDDGIRIGQVNSVENNSPVVYQNIGLTSGNTYTFILKATSDNAANFYSFDGPIANKKPKLEIEYIPR